MLVQYIFGRLTRVTSVPLSRLSSLRVESLLGQYLFGGSIRVALVPFSQLVLFLRVTWLLVQYESVGIILVPMSRLESLRVEIVSIIFI